MINKRAVTIFSLSIIMFMMIKDCDGWMAPRNSSCGAAECRVFEDDDLEFMMDIEVYRRILPGGDPTHKTSESGNQNSPACSPNCAGGNSYDPGRHCKTGDYGC
ncbi:hypothetical protein HanRHA438_Chr15g0724351 [Helianthus annuus]|uniref:Rapid ALkalinization Factor n=1 Tax=Helianthus annuus TaxID=4232 RepID=A0A9K3E3B4_HELAN|nr:hypothetical protein HanXRQr2_Chr15g0712051 [Helianthus annuus]KAJ0457546.1 hypothetical protein HanIR_Chr15g0774911 [Helianthus annuus]KAJ0832855.1 hypothetical protein HanPSC8_Chr15g0683481 [Helianthus annuus]KAJ0846396.1 hypothetical protein HanRHA438_Chr15g0724351 [Helianthus annuus]